MLRITTYTFLFFIFATPVFSYLGPGVGGGIIAASLGVIFAIIAGVFGIIWFPLKRYFKKKKQKKPIDKFKNID